MADTWVADYPELSPRVAFRWAHNLSHQDVADQWNQADPGQATLTKARIFEFEAWPKRGRRPSLNSLAMLARIYQTTGRRLLTDDEFSLFDEPSQAAIGDIDYRHLDPNQHMAHFPITGAEASTVTLISRPRVVHLVDGKEMLLVTAGTFPMGAARTPTFVSAFYMDATPVTNEEYARFVKDTGYQRPSHWTEHEAPAHLLDHPVVNVSLYDAVSYATWAEKRLPTAIEWEKAARGELGNRYPWGDRPAVAKCNVRESSINATTPVGKYRSGISPYGMHDMTGNVWEWCASETTPGRFVLKGSAFTSPFEAGQSAAMNDADGAMFDDDTGFRCVVTYDTAAPPTE